MDTSATVWKREITENRLEEWLANFKGEVLNLEEERRVGLWLLCNFVYYNEDEVMHLCATLFKDYLHQMLLDQVPHGPLNDDRITEVLSRSRFLPLGKPSESGGLILYYFRHANDLQPSYFLPPSREEATIVDRFVFLDDVTLTEGKEGQAYSLLKEFESPGKKVLLTFLATHKAVKELNSIGVEVISAIMLDDRNKCFSNDSFMFLSFPNLIERCKSFAHHYGSKARHKMPLGYKNGQFAFGFFYNTPDNTLPIFWGTENRWYPVVVRHDKNYSRKILNNEDKFV